MQFELKDPTALYPKPPFKKQKQPWPGLAREMDPPPDHGEKSYRGSGRLAGRKALITGGDSGMGRAAAIAYAREGADVAINYFPTEEPDAKEVIALIKDAGRKGVAIPGDLRDEAFCKELVARGGRQDWAASTSWSATPGASNRSESILDITTEDFDATMKTNIYAPFWIIKAALPHLKPGSAIIGTTSEQAYDPSPDLYDYAQTKAATMNYVKSLAKQLAPEGHSRQRRGARADLDAAAGERRRHDGEARKVRRPDAVRPARPAGGTRLDLRPARGQRCQLRHGPDLRLVRRRRPALNDYMILPSFTYSRLIAASSPLRSRRSVSLARMSTAQKCVTLRMPAPVSSWRAAM